MVEQKEAKFDFTEKLQQQSVAHSLRRYILWSREHRAGFTSPGMLHNWVPVSINLDLTTACNYACDHCIDEEILNSGDMFTSPQLETSLALMQKRGLKSVILIGGGEPTISPAFVTTARYMKRLGLQVAVVSNGGFGQRILEIADCLVERDWVRLSLDAGTNDTFIRTHKPRSKSLTLEGICEWIPKIKAVNSRFEIGFSFIAIPEGATQRHHDGKIVPLVPNIEEMVLATKLARDSGFDYISLKSFLERDDQDAEVMNPDGFGIDPEAVRTRLRQLIAQAKQFESPSFAVRVSTNLRVFLAGTWRSYTRQPRVCHKQAFQQVLTPTGLYNCPSYRGVDYAKIAGSDAYANPLAAHVTNDNLLRVLNTFDASERCANVTCFYNRMNRQIEEMIEGGVSADFLTLPDVPDFFL